MSTFSKTLALLFGMLVFGVQVSAYWDPDMGAGDSGKLIGTSFWLREDIISFLRRGYRNM